MIQSDLFLSGRYGKAWYYLIRTGLVQFVLILCRSDFCVVRSCLVCSRSSVVISSTILFALVLFREPVIGAMLCGLVPAPVGESRK